MPQLKQYNILSPDGFDISIDHFNTPEDAWCYFDEWLLRYKNQGYYSSNQGRIPLDILRKYVSLIQYEDTYPEDLENVGEIEENGFTEALLDFFEDQQNKSTRNTTPKK